MTASSSWRASTLSPFRSRTFLFIWTATLVSNFGSLIQAVGASWLMTSLAPSPDVVALVQASTSLPIMLLSLPSGAIADIWDRRNIMLIAQSMMLVFSVILAVLSFLQWITPWSLLTLTFLIGCGAALHGPAWQSSVGEQVPRADIPAAVSLNTLSFNLARTAGPALGGIIVAAIGAHGAFVVNALTYVGLIGVLLWWRRPKPKATLPPESMLRAMGAGVRYARLAPGIRPVLLRAFALGLFGSSIWALMPLVARDLLAGGPLTYGILFGSFGGGAVLGALMSTPLRARYGYESLVRVSTVVFAIAVGIIGISRSIAFTLPMFVAAGATWVLMLSTFNITVQMSSPRWVVGRTLAIYQMVTFGGLAIGSWLWGEVADGFGLPLTLVVSAVALALAALLGLKARLLPPESLNLAPAGKANPPLKPQIDFLPDSGPVVVTVEYFVDRADQAAFIEAMRELRRVRRRDGARRWTLMQDMAVPERWVERFHTPSWVEHLRRYERFTVADEEIERRALAFHRGPEPPRITHLLERLPTEAPLTREEAAATVVADPSLPPSR